MIIRFLFGSVRYCSECGKKTSHVKTANGSWVCRICGAYN